MDANGYDLSSNNKSRFTDTDNNLYLSKLKAAEKNNELNTSRYTPSNPESGVFSMSDYDQVDNGMRNASHNQNKKLNSNQALNNRDR